MFNPNAIGVGAHADGVAVKHLTLGRAKYSDMFIDSITVNQPLPKKHFTPELPAGTNIVMQDEMVTVPGSVQRITKVLQVPNQPGKPAPPEPRWLQEARRKHHSRVEEEQKQLARRRLTETVIAGLIVVASTLGAVVVIRRRWKRLGS